MFRTVIVVAFSLINNNGSHAAQPRGRLRKRWMDSVKEASVKVRGYTLKEIKQSALFLDRSQWKNFVTDKP